MFSSTAFFVCSLIYGDLCSPHEFWGQKASLWAHQTGLFIQRNALLKGMLLHEIFFQFPLLLQCLQVVSLTTIELDPVLCSMAAYTTTPNPPETFLLLHSWFCSALRLQWGERNLSLFVVSLNSTIPLFDPVLYQVLALLEEIFL